LIVKQHPNKRLVSLIKSGHAEFWALISANECGSHVDDLLNPPGTLEYIDAAPHVPPREGDPNFQTSDTHGPFNNRSAKQIISLLAVWKFEK